jgi:hypothetical protein
VLASLPGWSAKKFKMVCERHGVHPGDRHRYGGLTGYQGVVGYEEVAPKIKDY